MLVSIFMGFVAGAIMEHSIGHRPVLKVDLPEEIGEAKKGDILQVLKRTPDSISIGFHHIDVEYKIELINQTQAKVYNGVESKIISVDSIQQYIINDNL